MVDMAGGQTFLWAWIRPLMTVPLPRWLINTHHGQFFSAHEARPFWGTICKIWCIVAGACRVNCLQDLKALEHIRWDLLVQVRLG